MSAARPPRPSPLLASKGPPIDAGHHVGDRLDAIPLASVGVLLAISCTTTTLRVYWRMKPTWRIGPDDLTLVSALVSLPFTQ
jgi:hypothetical protein